jgi:hypothetical protein
MNEVDSAQFHWLAGGLEKLISQFENGLLYCSETVGGLGVEVH